MRGREEEGERKRRLVEGVRFRKGWIPKTWEETMDLRP